MHLIDAQQAILALRPTEFNPQFQYMVRLRPDIKMKTWTLSRTGIKLRKDDEWIAVSAPVARVLSHYSETGRTFQAMRFTARHRSQRLRPLVDIATCKEDADRIEDLYELDRRQMMPGTTDQPHKMLRTADAKSRAGLQEIERQLGLVVQHDARFDPPKFGPSMQVRAEDQDPATERLASEIANLQAEEARRTPSSEGPKPPADPSRPARPSRGRKSEESDGSDK